MRDIGKVIAILNEDFLLVELESGSLTPGEEVSVVSEVSVNSLKDKYHIDKVRIPKGKIVTVNHQEGNIYLMTLKVRKTRKTITKPKMSALDALFQTSEEVIVKEDIDGDAIKLNQDQSLKLDFDSAISIGDIISVN